MAKCYQKVGEMDLALMDYYDASEENLEKALNLRQRFFGKEHPLTRSAQKSWNKFQKEIKEIRRVKDLEELQRQKQELEAKEAKRLIREQEDKEYKERTMS